VNTALAVGVVLLVWRSDVRQSGLGLRIAGDRTFLCTACWQWWCSPQFHWSRTARGVGVGALSMIDTVFFAATANRRGWLGTAVLVSRDGMMTSWKRGRDILLSRWKQSSMPLAPFLARLPQSRIIRCPGPRVHDGQPGLMCPRHCCTPEHNKVLHENVLFVTVENEDVPEVSQRRRARSVGWRRDPSR